MSVQDIMTSIMTRKELTAAMEIIKFLKATGLEEISRQAWFKARLKLNPEVFRVLNDFFIDLQICTVKESEIQAAEENIKAIKRIGIKQKTLIIFDRGYPSIELLNCLEEQGISYIIRIPSAMYLKERREAEGDGCKVELEHTYRRMARIKKNDGNRDEAEKQYEKIKSKGSTKTRLVRGKTPSGEEFAVLTNLSDEINREKIVEAYFLRWNIEEAYSTLKNKMKFESVSGKASVYVGQDFLSQVLVYNLMEDDRDIRSEKMGILLSEIKKYTLPVRKSKSRKRRFNTSNKYACNQKPSF